MMDTGLTATDGNKDVSRDEIQKYQLEQLEIVSMALDELGAIVLRASVADHLKNERHSSECKEQEAKLKQLKQACRQLQRDAKASREARTELASQMATLQLQYQSLLDASEKQRAMGQAASRKYDALVLKSVSLIQQLEGRCGIRYDFPVAYSPSLCASAILCSVHPQLTADRAAHLDWARIRHSALRRAGSTTSAQPKRTSAANLSRMPILCTQHGTRLNAGRNHAIPRGIRMLLALH